MLADSGADLEKQECSCNREPLEMAANRGHLEVVKFLEGKGAQVRDKKLFNEVLMLGDNTKMDAEKTNLLQYLVDRNPEYLASHEHKLFELCADAEFNLLEALIKVGANANAKNSKGQSLLDVMGTKKSAWDHAHDEKLAKRMQKMKTLLEKAMKKNEK